MSDNFKNFPVLYIVISVGGSVTRSGKNKRTTDLMNSVADYHIS